MHNQNNHLKPTETNESITSIDLIQGILSGVSHFFT